MLSKIDTLIRDEFKGNNILLDLSVLIQKHFKHENVSETEDFLYRKDNDKNVQRFIAVCFLRLVANNNYIHIETNKHQIFKHIIEAIPDVCSQMGITDKTETYKKEIAIRDFILEREKEYRSYLIFKGSLNGLSTFQHDFRRVVNNKRNISFKIFCGDLLKKHTFDSLFTSINNFIDADEEDKFKLYSVSESQINTYLEDCQRTDTEYSIEFLYRPFLVIKEMLKREMEKSPYFLPAKLSIDKTEKRYPFFSNAKGSISLLIVNVGDGYATNVSLSIIDFNKEYLAFSETVKYIGNLHRENVIVAFPYLSLSNFKRIRIRFDLTWTSNNIEDISTREIIFESQRTGLIWEDVSILTPYNLEPVESNSELIGRSSILQNLMKMLNFPLGSAYIYGQRRVGKTSIVKTLQNTANFDDVLILYIEAGDWNDAFDAHKSMDNLGLKICKKIKRSHNKFGHIEIPNFNGSFNKISDFLDDVTDVDKNFKVLIILDEFDRISSTLYERGDIGKSFILTIRSITNRPQFGFILVGGEKMEYILSPWQEFNKFSPIRVDYFSKERDWEDFRQLVKKPVENILDISDKAIHLLFDETSGNPYFTKKICMELYTLMIENRDIHVTENEVVNSIEIARNTSNIGATDFSHFWEDGIKGKVDKEEEVSLIRRKLLIIMAQLLNTGYPLGKELIKDKAYEIGLKDSDVEKYLMEFEQRTIIYFEYENYHFVVNFFKEWLIDGGKEKIVSTFEEEERVSMYQRIEEEVEVKSDEIAVVAKSFQNYKGRPITNLEIRNWLNQFDDVFEQRIMFKLVKNFKLYSELEVREHVKKSFLRILSSLNKRGNIRQLESHKRKRDDILVTYIDSSPAKGSSYYTKLFADENNIYSENVVSPELIERKLSDKSGIKAIVIVDDFIGTGRTLVENFNTYISSSVAELLTSKHIPVYISVITGYLNSKESVLDHIGKKVDCELMIGDILSDDDRCFSSSSRIFDSPSERRKAKDICTAKGELLDIKMPLGYDNTEALVAFPINCPNNTLTVFWKRTNKWTPLFERT